MILLEVRTWPTDGKLFLPTPFPNITAVHRLNGLKREPLNWFFNDDATRLHLEVPAQAPATLPATIALETAEKTSQFTDGRIVFSALDAKVQGTKARLESHPGNHRIGFWTDPVDSVSWDFKPTRWGMYDLDLAFSAERGNGTELQFDLAGQTFRVTRPSTGSWYRYRTIPIGRFYLARAEPFTLRASCSALEGGAVMNLKAVTLRPAPEGKPILQEASGALTLLARDATTHSVMLRYEPATNKNCLGYWVDPNDWADWEFTVTQPGTFELELWQGCGKGQGGSDAEVEVGGRKFGFVVEETGHFQNFVPRRLGQVNLLTPGTHSLAIRATRKQAGAVMDVQQVRLVPVAAGQNAPAKAAQFLHARRIVFLGDSITYSGHWLIAREILRYLDAPDEIVSSDGPDALMNSCPRGAEVLKLVQQRQRMIKDAWLTHVGHGRPGMNKGKPLPEAEHDAEELESKIRELTEVPCAGGFPAR